MAGLAAAVPRGRRVVSAASFAALLSVVVVVAGALLAATAHAQRPNIVLIMADDRTCTEKERGFREAKLEGEERTGGEWIEGKGRRREGEE